METIGKEAQVSVLLGPNPFLNRERPNRPELDLPQPLIWIQVIQGSVVVVLNLITAVSKISLIRMQEA